MTRQLKPVDLVRVIYSAGKVFDGLQTSLLNTESFLRTDNLETVASKIDLAILQDMRDLSLKTIALAEEEIDVNSLVSLNKAISRSGSLNPGVLRRDDENIGVSTQYGRHEPPAVNLQDLQVLLDKGLEIKDSQEAAMTVFIDMAKAQPFGDGNKRTALFLANAVLLQRETEQLLTIPHDEKDLSLSNEFNRSLAKAYIFDDEVEVKNLLRDHGFISLETESSIVAKNRRNHPELFEAVGKQNLDKKVLVENLLEFH